MVQAATVAAPDDELARFDFAGGSLPHAVFGYELRVRVFDDAGVVSIPAPGGVFVQAGGNSQGVQSKR